MLRGYDDTAMRQQYIISLFVICDVFERMLEE